MEHKPLPSRPKARKTRRKSLHIEDAVKIKEIQDMADDVAESIDNAVSEIDDDNAELVNLKVDLDLALNDAKQVGKALEEIS